MEVPVNTGQVETKEATIEVILKHLIIRILGVTRVIPLLNIHQGEITLTMVEIIILEVAINIEYNCL